MSLKVQDVTSNSLASISGFLPDDSIETVNGQEIRDMIDFQYVTSDEELTFQVMRESTPILISMSREPWQEIGLELEPMKYHLCGNACVFCFVDQNPKGMRKSLMFKDEDYRLSFLHGNYVTLTHMKQNVLDRIAKQRLSPLYLSIHATDLVVRKKLLNISFDDHLLDKLEFLSAHHIEMHGQIVLCPGFNDGDVLESTIRNLLKFYPALHTLAIVPVGLTKHRNHLAPVPSVSNPLAKGMIREISVYQDQFMGKYGHAFVYLSDEFYLLAGEPIPDSDHYGEYWQIENGVGLTRYFLDQFEKIKPTIPEKVGKKIKCAWIVGEMIAPVIIKEVLPFINHIQDLHVDLIPVTNYFFGESVRVTGLLTGEDIIKAVKTKLPYDTVFIPQCCVNTDGIFLDDLTIDNISDKLHCEIRILNDFSDLWKN